MVDFDDKDSGVSVSPPESRNGDKKTATAFAAVRERGMLNAGLDVLAKRYEEANPGRKCRWEFYTSGDMGKDQVIMREGMGWKLADYSEFGGHTESTPQTGIVRRGDLVLMHTDEVTDREYRLQDAMAAHADLKAPERAFKDSVEQRKVKLEDGTTDQARGVGQIKVREEIVSVRPDKDSEGGS